MKQDPEQFHRKASRAAGRSGRSRFDVARQPLAARNNQEPVEIEEWKAGEISAFYGVTGLFEKGSNCAAIEVLAMPYVSIEGGHRSAGNCHN